MTWKSEKLSHCFNLQKEINKIEIERKEHQSTAKMR